MSRDLIASELEELHARHRFDDSGAVADYIPELPRADPACFVCWAHRGAFVGMGAVDREQVHSGRGTLLDAVRPSEPWVQFVVNGAQPDRVRAPSRRQASPRSSKLTARNPGAHESLYGTRGGSPRAHESLH